MKRTEIILLLLMGILAIGMAQKTVAVWDITVAKGSEEVSALRKSQIMSALETGVVTSAGYKAFARTALDKIKQERKFQTGGEVSDNDIRKIGQMAGVDFILLPEVAKEGMEMNVNVKVLNIESGAYDNASYEYISNATGENINIQCVKLAQRLFGGSTSSFSSSGRDSSFAVEEVPEVPAGYTDLGLPSGTYWKNSNESGGFYTYEQAVNRFGSKLPTKEQFEELKNSCSWQWIGNGYKVTGPNSNFIILPAAGSRNCNGGVAYVGSWGRYVSSTPYGSSVAWYFSFDSGGVDMGRRNRCYGQSVRLVTK